MEVLFALSGALVATAWYELAHRHREVKSHQALCRHVWGEVEELGGKHGPPRGRAAAFGRMFYVHCRACALKKDVNADGSDLRV